MWTFIRNYLSSGSPAVRQWASSVFSMTSFPTDLQFLQGELFDIVTYKQAILTFSVFGQRKFDWTRQSFPRFWSFSLCFTGIWSLTQQKLGCKDNFDKI